MLRPHRTRNPHFRRKTAENCYFSYFSTGHSNFTSTMNYHVNTVVYMVEVVANAFELLLDPLRKTKNIESENFKNGLRGFIVSKADKGMEKQTT